MSLVETDCRKVRFAAVFLCLSVEASVPHLMIFRNFSMSCLIIW